MSRTSRIVLTGGLAVALGVGGVWNSFAWDNEPNPAPVPHFPLPSDGVHDPVLSPAIQPQPPGTNDFWFLTYNNGGAVRLDNPVSACAYYKKIGAVTGCGTDGSTFENPTTFKKWKQDVKIGRGNVTSGFEEDVAHFINQVDLNLTRDHHMVSYGPEQLAGYVCNHNGPAATTEDPTQLFPTQPEVDALIKSIKDKSTLVACVAMEYSSRTSPSDPPFTKFWIFDPDGNLASGVDLDGRGTKYVPNVCTACHGGPFDYNTSVDGGVTAQFDPLKQPPPVFADGTPRPPGDLGAHFLPFDIANFAFSTKLPQPEQEKAIFALNMNVYNTEKTRTTGTAHPSAGSDSIVQLIDNWYNHDVTPGNNSPQLKRDFVAPKWQMVNPPVTGNVSDPSFLYQNVIARSCRTCHVAMDNVPSEVTTPPTFNVPAMQSAICNNYFPGSTLPLSAAFMPNSKVTFDRFWLSQESVLGNVTGSPAVIDQPDNIVPGCPDPNG